MSEKIKDGPSAVDLIATLRNQASWSAERSSNYEAFDCSEILIEAADFIEKACRWQPIETAPKDGTPILLTGGSVDSGERYDDSAYSPPAVVGWRDKYGWRFCSYDSGCYGDYAGPTHWMPLPEPSRT